MKMHFPLITSFGFVPANELIKWNLYIKYFGNCQRPLQCRITVFSLYEVTFEGNKGLIHPSATILQPNFKRTRDIARRQGKLSTAMFTTHLVSGSSFY